MDDASFGILYEVEDVFYLWTHRYGFLDFRYAFLTEFSTLIKQAVSRIGSAEIPTDPMPMERADIMVSLKPKAEWTSAETTDELMEKTGLDEETAQKLIMAARASWTDAE